MPPTVFPSSTTSRTAPVLNASLNRRRDRRSVPVLAIVDIVSAFQKVSTKPDQAQRFLCCQYIGPHRRHRAGVRPPVHLRIPTTWAQPDATFRIDPATPADVPLILALIRELAEYEKLLDAVVSTEELIHESLFGDSPHSEAVVARVGDEAVGFTLYSHTFSTFLARPGLYREDLYVRPEHRGNGCRRRLLVHLARIAGRPRLRPVRVVGPGLERASAGHLPPRRSRPDG